MPCATTLEIFGLDDNTTLPVDRRNIWQIRRMPTLDSIRQFRGNCILADAGCRRLRGFFTLYRVPMPQ